MITILIGTTSYKTNHGGGLGFSIHSIHPGISAAIELKGLKKRCLSR